MSLHAFEGRSRNVSLALRSVYSHEYIGVGSMTCKMRERERERERETDKQRERQRETCMETYS